MRYIVPLLLLIAGLTGFFSCSNTFTGVRTIKKGIHFYAANNKYYRFTGRFDFSNRKLPRVWNPGAYIEVGFEGTFLEIEINDEKLYGGHNYIEVVIDDLPPRRIQLVANNNILLISDSLENKKHTLLICKNTESSMGYIELVGISCQKLLPPKHRTKKIEFIGDSITCGNGSDNTGIKCGDGTWYDQHNAYLSYGPIVSRILGTDWQLSSVSGIGMYSSCCGMVKTMPQVYNKINFETTGPDWNMPSDSKTNPDIVVITLGQNDGIQDSTDYCSTYLAFVRKLRKTYKNATFICCTSPMADPKLQAQMARYIPAITSELHRKGDLNVHSFIYKGMYRSGCTLHPTLAEHREIAKELIPFVKEVSGW